MTPTPASPVDTAVADASAGDVAGTVGERLRALRLRQGISARDLAARLGISPSAVSQIERGVMQPSVSRLIAISDALDVPLTSVFDAPDVDDVPATRPVDTGFGLRRASQDSAIELGSGVTFRRISPVATPGVDYFESEYPAGSSAHGGESLFRHEGYEVGTVVSGELTIDFDDERVVLRAGDAISYPCSRPHRLHNAGAEPAVARWLIVHGGH
ncbi:helix-turn-helix domain-containing protein [Microbacterium dextranolyticum]|uniref:XRE family transcriptional regulator n=1 Tax=Microbacterium dextranolyticum TaxID=36806 RepID=A0A9W6HM72_9MICO|nr:helix-turn-helix domain-containing protein [Microbacterium dextranolyticum]MBM7464400.1 transcriptional regulator with XRE-family HTH domain [Microbacterium dextranolyticum]GLJ95397.1 XRE family transcriptional regulator [Microbacterium dextranolyticum]